MPYSASIGMPAASARCSCERTACVTTTDWLRNSGASRRWNSPSASHDSVATAATVSAIVIRNSRPTNDFQ